MEIAAVKAALFFFLIFWVYFCIILILLKESFQGISEETCWKLLHWSSWQPGPLCYTSLSIEVNSMKWCQEALTEHVFMYPVSLCSSSFLPRQLRNWAKLRYTVRCCMGTTKKAWCLLYGGGSVELEIWNVSVGGHWASAEINPLLQILTPGVYSWRRAEIVPAPLLAWWSQARERTGTASSVELLRLLLSPALLSPSWCDRESSLGHSQCHAWVVRGKSAISWQDGSVISPEEMGRK